MSPATAPPEPVTAAATIWPVTAAELGRSWRPGCPVGPAQLRRVQIDHIGFDARTHRGELIVHEELVAQVIVVFEQLYHLGYPIEKMRPVGDYPEASDELSMEDDNTSAFNCRRIPVSGRWAQHAYGRAIDVNPLLNPSVDGSTFEPKNARVYTDRNRIEPGLLHPGDPAVRVFTDRGWRWGGLWKSPIDYQHFELSR
ncbi:MAG: M15 family metallopeptidase [Mycobacterium sp.]